MVLMLAIAPVARVHAEDAQAKAQRLQMESEIATRKAEVAALIAADIAKNPNGANAIAARKAAEEAKALEDLKQTAEEKTKANADAAAKAVADKAAAETQAAADAWAAGAADRARAAARQKAAVEKWRASGKGAASIMMGHRADGTYTVMVDGQLSTFATEAEAQAFADKARSKSEPTLSY